MDRHALKIYVLELGQSQYQVLSHFTRSFSEALFRQGHEVRVYQNSIPSFEHDKPDLTLSFFPMDGIINKQRIWDYLKIPHLHYTVDAPDYIINLLDSPYYFATQRDLDSIDYLKNKGYSNVVFLPHAADPAELSPFKESYSYEVSFLGTSAQPSLDFIWFNDYPLDIQKAALRAKEIYNGDDTTGYHLAFDQAAHELSLTKKTLANINFSELMQELDLAIRNEERLKLLTSIQSIPVNLWGNSINDIPWKESLKNQKNMIYHPATTFSEALKIMSESKIILNSSAATKHAGHERIFYAFLKGALPITLKNPFLEKYFVDEESILFYEKGKESAIEPKIKKILANEPLRQKIVSKGQEIVLKHHTWDERAKTLLAWQPIIRLIENKKEA